MTMLRRTPGLIQTIAPSHRISLNAERLTDVGRAVGFKRRTSNTPHRAPPHRSSSSTSSPPAAAPPSVLRSPLRWYASQLDARPLATKCVTSGLISGSGDLLCQYLHAEKRKDGAMDGRKHPDEGESEFDWMQTLRFAILGSFLVAPTVHAWYGFLMSSVPGSGVAAVAKRLFCDQGLFAPLFTPTFITCLTVLEHVSPGDDGIAVNEGDGNTDLFSRVTTRLRNDVPEALVVGWAMWVPSMAIMFAFVPGKFQVLYSNCVGFVWNAYLSWRTHEGEEEDEIMRGG